jgi:predicted PilT family ATPase
MTPGVVLRGEPGIGKSALAAAAARLALDSGAVVVTLTGSALHTDAGLTQYAACSNSIAA